MNAVNPAGAVPVPEHLVPQWNRLNTRARARIRGPWDSATGRPFADRVKAEVTILRACGWSLEHIIELARLFPEGLGAMGSAAAATIAGIWHAREAEAVRVDPPPATTGAGVAFGPFQILGVGELLQLPERGYLLKGIMSPGELSVWWGPPKCGKSFLLLHVAYALAQGRQVFGRRVRKCRVLYIACEGRSGLRGRIEALAKRYGEAPDFLAIAQPVDLMMPDGDTAALREVIEHFAPDLVVVDTVNRVMAGGDENSSADMGALIRHLDELRAPLLGREHGPHVAAIHHGTKEGRNGPRGHGSLLGAVDASIEVTADEEGNRTAKLDAMKDDAGGALAFRLEVEDLGPDADGDPRTTCLVVEEGDAPARKRKARSLTETQAGWLRDLQDMFAEPETLLRVPIQGMPETPTRTRDEIRVGLRGKGRFECDSHGNLTTKDRDRLREALNQLKDKGKIGMTADLVWLL